MVYILAELHGVKQNADAIRYFVNKYKITSVYLEYYPDLELEIQRFVYTSNPITNAQILNFFEDGRMYSELLLTLRKMYKNGEIKKVLCFADSSSEDGWNSREKAYFKSFKSKYTEEENVLIVVGNLHAIKVPFEIENKKAYSFTNLLSKKYEVHIIKLKYLNGRFYNFGIKDFKDYKNKLTDFNEEYVIENATHVNKVELLKLY